MFPIIFPSKPLLPYAPSIYGLFITFQGRWWQTFQHHGASEFLGLSRWITLWEFNIAIENCPFSSLIYLLKMVIFHFAILVYQKVPKDTIIFRHQGLNGFFFRWVSWCPRRSHRDPWAARWCSGCLRPDVSASDVERSNNMAMLLCGPMNCNQTREKMLVVGKRMANRGGLVGFPILRQSQLRFIPLTGALPSSQSSLVRKKPWLPPWKENTKDHLGMAKLRYPVCFSWF